MAVIPLNDALDQNYECLISLGQLVAMRALF